MISSSLVTLLRMVTQNRLSLSLILSANSIARSFVNGLRNLQIKIKAASAEIEAKKESEVQQLIKEEKIKQ